MDTLFRRSAIAVALATTTTAAAVAALLAGQAAASAQDAGGTSTETLADVADAYANTVYPGTALGATSDLRVGSAFGGVKTSYLQFTIPSADAPRITAATLTLTRTNHHLPATTITASSAPSTWTESGLTATNAPAVGATLSSQQVDPTTSTVSFDVTAAAQNQTTFSVALTSPVTTDTAIFASREAGAGAPSLTLTLAAPAPSPAPAPTTPAPTSPAPSGPTCTVSAILVSSCQTWLGDSPQSHALGNATTTAKLAMDEGFTGRQFDILHEYNTNGTLFPSASSIALAQQGRILFENWKPSTYLTWAQVAAGAADATIDREAAYLKANFTEPFFLAIYHEPEDNVIPVPGLGMTTADYVAMYRHTVLRLRADGVTNAITVMDYMGFSRWNPMRNALYPGDDVVDWIAWDPYTFAPGNTPGHDFAALVDTPSGGYPGFYDWATQTHPGKPLMLAEWGAYDNQLVAHPNGPAQFYSTVAQELPQFPALKALVYFTMNPADVAAGNGTQPTETAAGLAAWQQLAASPLLNGPAIGYQNNAVVQH